MRISSLTALAKVGFEDLSLASERLDVLESQTGVARTEWLQSFAAAADPDAALDVAVYLATEHAEEWGSAQINLKPQSRQQFLNLVGASNGLAAFLRRHPSELSRAVAKVSAPLSQIEYTKSLCASVQAHGGYSTLEGEAAWTALRARYRRHLLDIALFDLAAAEAPEVLAHVAAALSDLAAATLEAALSVARTNVVNGFGVGRTYTREEVDNTRLAVIAMGKCGARELNYVSDVDVIFVAEAISDEVTSQETMIGCATRLATEMMRAIHDAAIEPALWQVDPNLRPEGKNGPLVRTLSSHLAYYERWAKSWEFQALLKARFVAGDELLGADYVDLTRPLVWSSAARENFVESAQRMRERVMENIPDADVDYQLKLGPGGLRDVEFTVQLLQLVHGQKDESIRVSATLGAIEQLALGGYIARADAEELQVAYRYLRVLEHRLQLRELTRTALFPRRVEDQRWLARASGLADSASQLIERWESTKDRVRELHLKIFYAPLLSAVAALPGDEFTLTGEEAADRLSAIGFSDPEGALRHIRALSSGVSRRAVIQRNLLPVILQWLSEGADPDYGLLAFRRISDTLGTTPWYLRLLRDGAGAALRLTHLLASSRFVGELMEGSPESVAWLDGDDELRAVGGKELRDEMAAIASRHAPIDRAMPHLLSVRRREVLRLAMGSLLGVLDVSHVSRGLTELYESLIATVLDGVREKLRTEKGVAAAHGPAESPDGIEFAIVELGRLGGAELGFSSDLDVMYVYRAISTSADEAARLATSIVDELHRLLSDAKLPFDIDMDLRPEGRSGARVRSLDSYRSYYQRWSLTWEAQALLRARCLIGDELLCRDFTALADEIRYPAQLSDESIREIRRIKARVEAERLPQGADPTRHLKLGKGSVSDVEWLVQLMQLEHAHEVAELRVQSTIDALTASIQLGYLSADDGQLLQEAWSLSSELRAAHMLWSGRSSDVLPRDRSDLDGIARIIGMPAGSTTLLEERYLAVTRRARAVFEREFFGYAEEDEPRGYLSQ